MRLQKTECVSGPGAIMNYAETFQFARCARSRAATRLVQIPLDPMLAARGFARGEKRAGRDLNTRSDVLTSLRATSLRFKSLVTVLPLASLLVAKAGRARFEHATV